MEARRCKTPLCLNDARKGKYYCHKCASRKNREKNVITYLYHSIKWGAHQRGIKFELTKEYFIEFCSRTNYPKLRGVNPDDMTIDKIVDSLGYVDGNIQMLSNRDNVAKWHKDRKKTWGFDVGTHDGVPF